MTKSESHPLGYSEAEARRLEAQGALYKDLTEDPHCDVFNRATTKPMIVILPLCRGVRLKAVGH